MSCSRCNLIDRLYMRGDGHLGAEAPAFLQPDVFYREGLSTDFNADGSLNLDGIGASNIYQCVEIGPRSDLDALYLFSNGLRPPLPKSTTQYARDPFLDGKLLKVGRPWVGEVKGPLTIIPKAAEWSRGTTRDSAAYGRLRFDLLLHRVMPQHVALRRPDDTRRYYTTLASGNTAAGQVLNFPAFGREDIVFNFFTNISTSGTITFRIYSVTAALGAGSEILLDTIAVTTAGALNNAREYEGKVDGYAITVQGASMADAASLYDIHVRLKDKL